MINSRGIQLLPATNNSSPADSGNPRWTKGRLYRKTNLHDGPAGFLYKIECCKPDTSQIPWWVSTAQQVFNLFIECFILSCYLTLNPKKLSKWFIQQTSKIYVSTQRERDRLTERHHASYLERGWQIMILPILLAALTTLTTLHVLNALRNNMFGPDMFF